MCRLFDDRKHFISILNSLIMSMMRLQVLAGFGFFIAGLSGLIFDEFANAPQVLDEATILLVSLRGFGMPENR